MRASARRDWVRMGAYGAALALGTVLLQWLDYQQMARMHARDIYVALVAALFLALGIFVGTRLIAPPARKHFDGNPAARAALGISAREYDVLCELAAGRSNKEIAARLHVSPNTVKTHVARLYEKLGAHRRTDAVAKARELGMLR